MLDKFEIPVKNYYRYCTSSMYRASRVKRKGLFLLKFL